jgi:putative hemolysin
MNAFMLASLPAPAEWILWSALAAIGLACSALYSGFETGAYVLNKMRLDLRAEAGSTSARALRAMLRRFDVLLTSLLIGSNFAEYLVTFSISVLLAMGGAGDRTEWYALAISTTLLFVLGESVPKNLFQRSPDRLVYRLVRPVKWSMAAFRWCGILGLVRALGRLLTRRIGKHHAFAHEGLAAILAEGRAAGALTHAQSIMADRVLHLTDVTVAAVMKPLASVLKAPRSVSHEGILELVREANYTRVPLMNDDGSVAGILDTYEVLMAEGPVAPRQKMQPPLVLPDAWTVTDALYHLQTEHASMAVVADPGGRHVGIVTVKDLVEQIVGELGAW